VAVSKKNTHQFTQLVKEKVGNCLIVIEEETGKGEFWYTGLKDEVD